MGRWKGIQLATREMVANLEQKELERVLESGWRSECERQGYHPIGKPHAEWHEVGDIEFMMQPFPWPVEEGDWVIRLAVEVAEEEEISPNG